VHLAVLSYESFRADGDGGYGTDAEFHPRAQSFLSRRMD